MLQNHIIKDLVDYVTGVETGLDSNGRKNRGGHLMENLVEKYIQEAGFVRDVNYFKEMYLVDIEKNGKLICPHCLMMERRRKDLILLLRRRK